MAGLSPLASAAELTAGDLDDNLNFHAYSAWAQRLQGERPSLPALNITDRVTVRVVDSGGSPVSRAAVSIGVPDEQEPRLTLPAGTDGVLRFFPALDVNATAREFTLSARAPDGPAASSQVALDLDAPPENRTLTLTLDAAVASAPEALDLMIVLDTTGSMADELNYLKTQLGSIIENVTLEHGSVDIRFSLVVYRDIGDVYVVRSFPFTSSLQSIQADLEAQTAYDGGDFPEAMDLALAAAVAADWRGGNTARVALVVADAPPHAENYAATVEAVRQARAAGIQIYALAASGVDPSAEYILRAGAALTGARYMFLTDDSGVGNAHAEPSTLCYQVTVLSKLISRVISSEIYGQRVEAAPEDVLRTVGNFSQGVCLSAPGNEESPVLPYVPTAVADGMYHPTTTASSPSTDPTTAEAPAGSPTASPAPSVSFSGDTAGPSLAYAGEATAFSSHRASSLETDGTPSESTMGVEIPASASSPATLAAGRTAGSGSPLAVGLLVLALALAIGTSAALWSQQAPRRPGAAPGETTHKRAPPQ